ncbi:MAG TPA: ABC transporter permease, partial [Bryobacteraceae bacterium]|nr:ABC transporter permease [Bryobacteraceae bacterium]
DGEWSAAPGQWKSAAIGAFALLLPTGLLLVREGALDPKYASKYRLLAMTAGPAEVGAAVIADEIALMTLLVSVTGLIALLEWQSLFPSSRDYLALASLPVRSCHVFTARFTSVLLFSTAMIAALNLLPSLIAPMEFGGGWRLDCSYWLQAGTQALASGLACFCVFFAVLAIQGVLLNVVPPSLFSRVSVGVQGGLAGVFLFGGFYSWSIKEWKPETITRLPEFGAWLPPVWFTGLRQALAGENDAFFLAMAQRAWIAFGIAVALAIGTYLLSYRRYRKLLLESPVRLATARIRHWSMLRLLARSPRREAIMDFLAKTLLRSRTHRLLWLIYLGAAAAVLVNSSLVDGAIFARSRAWNLALQFVVHFWPLACSVVILSGFRHVLSIPAELRANWIFQITESQGRAEWMSAVERFIIAYAIAPVYVVLFPVAGVVSGWPMAIRMTVLQLLVSLSMFEALFYSWQKLPFTCSHIPGDRPLVGIVSKYLAILCVLVPILSLMIAVASQVAFLFCIYLVMFGGLWIWLRRRRREGWGEAKLIYEDSPVVVTELGIQELTYAGTEAQLRRSARDAGQAGGGVHPANLRGVPPAPRGRSSPLAADVGRPIPNHGSRLTALPFGEALTAVWLRLRTVLRRQQLDRDLEDELQFHLAMREERLQSSGVADAPYAARRRFGNMTLFKETCRDIWTFGWIEALWQDARYGCRQLRMNRGFAVIATLALSLGIAATTTIYGVCTALVWQTLPFPNSNALVVVLEAAPGSPHFWLPSSPADVEDIRKSDALMTGFASWENATANIVDMGGDPLRVDQARVTPSFFDVIGVRPQLGRPFDPNDSQPEQREVILSDGLWRNRFGADRGILGRSIRINDQDHTVIGVMPPKFAFPRASKELWTLLTLTAEERNARSAPRVDSVGRLKPGCTLLQVQSELDGLALRLEKLYPKTNL